MKALVLTAPKVFEYLDVDDPQPAENEVLVRVHACGICGSDVHGYDGSTGRRIPPIIMGHEAAGEITAIGSAVKNWQRGDRVTFDSTIFCNTCAYCLQGMVNLCENRRVLGVSCQEYRQNGAFAEYVAIPQHILYRLPEGVSYEQACLVEPLSIAFHAARLTPVTINDTAVVVGAGMIGLLVIQTMKLAGCGKVIAVDIDDRKLELAQSLGADHCINSKNTNAVDIIRNITGGKGASLSLDAVGTNASLETAIACLKNGGHLTLIGNITPKVDLPLQSVVTRQLRIQGSCASSGEYPACLDMIAAGRVNIDFLISQVAPLNEGKQWFDTLYEGKSGLLKVILKP